MAKMNRSSQCRTLASKSAVKTHSTRVGLYCWDDRDRTRILATPRDRVDRVGCDRDFEGYILSRMSTKMMANHSTSSHNVAIVREGAKKQLSIVK